VLRALLYLPDAAALPVAATDVFGRPLAVRAMVAALRAGAASIAVPTRLRDAAVERALRRMPALAAAIHWLDADAASPADGSARWLLLPASSLVDAGTLEALLADPAGRPAVLAGSADGAAPVAVAPGPPPAHLWSELAAGRQAGVALGRWLGQAGALPRPAVSPWVDARGVDGPARAEAALQATLSIPADSAVDRHLHRRVSRWLTHALVRTSLTPNQVSLVSLTIGLGAIWCFWDATPASAFAGVILYALACVVDHSDGELARLTFQESAFGASLDWTIDTIVHAGLVLGIGLTAGGHVMTAMGVLGAAGVTLSAIFAHYLPREIEIGPSVGGVLRNIGNRDLFYILLLGAAVLRWLAPSLVGIAAVVVGLGSQAYWVSCLARIRQLGRRRTA
jgi:phosphatidylglycerophosphate synthase